MIGSDLEGRWGSERWVSNRAVDDDYSDGRCGLALAVLVGDEVADGVCLVPYLTLTA